jgi:capsular polysaccharide transport system permease protein
MTEERIEDRSTQKPLRTLRSRLPALFRDRASVPVAAVSGEIEIVKGASPREPRLSLPHRSTGFGFSGYFITLIGLVVIPAFFITIYFIFLASDQYIAEARFAVRKAQSTMGASEKLSSTSATVSAAGAGIPNSSDQEAHIVANYLRSRSAIEDIRKDVNIVEIFQRPEGDFWARLKKNPSAEEITDYWNTMITTYVDGPSGVVTVSARAFRAEDAKRLVDAFITVSERLANQLSERARRDAMQKSESEVRRTEAMVRDALVELRHYRDEEGLITPLMEATSTSKLLMEAMSERIKLQNDYFVSVRALSPEAPTLLNMKTRLDSLDAEIEKLKRQLTSRSGEARSVSASLVRFEELEMRRIFSERMYTLAQDALERSRLKAEQQAIYVSVFVPAYLPQEARFPERFSMSLILSIGLFLIWGVGALSAAAVQDHTL